MFYLRQADKRGRTQTDWLDSRHTFSFGQYYDPRFMAFSDLRVINDDVVAPSGGFGTHPHDNMEIVSVVFAGRLEHKDSLGSGSISGKFRIRVHLDPFGFVWFLSFLPES